MKYSFYMNADNYCYAFSYMLKKTKRYSNLLITAVISSIYMIALSALLHRILIGIAGSVIFFALTFTAKYFNKKAIKTQFMSSPILTGLHTLTAYDEGLEIINSYEKMFVPWQSIYDIKDETDKLIILPTYRKGVIVIDKLSADKQELNSFMSLLLGNTGKEGR